jgi:hypothetical protein
VALVVPRAQSQVQQQSIGVGRTVQTPDADFFGGGMEKVGRAIGQIGQGLEDNASSADQERTKEAYNQLVERKQKAIFDPKEGAMTRKGKNAVGVVEEYGTRFDKEADEIEGSLANERQKRMFKSLRAKERGELSSTLERHTYGEMEKHQDEVTEQGIEVQRNEAALNFQDPAKVRDSLEKQALYVTDYAQKRGKPKEWLDTKLADIQTKTHSAVIDRMLNADNDVGAKAYFDANRATITDADELGKIEKALEVGTLRGEGQRQSLDIAGRHGDMRAALADVDKIKDPKVQDEVRRRVKERFSEREAAKNYAQEQNFERAFDIVAKERRLDAIPAGMLSQMSPSQRKEIESYLKSDRTVTDRDTYEEIKLGLANPETRVKYLTMDLNTVRSKLSESDFQEIVKDRAKLAQGDKKAAAKFDGFMSDAQTVDTIMGQAGIRPKSDQAKKFKAKLDALVIQRQEATGKKITNDDLRALSSGLLVEGVTSKGFLWDSKAKAFELEPGQTFEDIEVPSKDEAEISAILRQRNKPLTRENIVKYYLKGKARGG